jgi:endonuclease YncB( thermonuclease family)
MRYAVRTGRRSMRIPVSRLALVMAAHCLELPVAAQTVVDGDSIELNGKTYRLYGIDAPDDGQICPDGWPAAYEAEAYLGQLIGGKTVTCMPIGLPQRNETDAICRADGVDVGAAMVTGGMAYAFVPYSVRYLTQEDAAASANRGVHRHKCLAPWTWRARVKQSD